MIDITNGRHGMVNAEPAQPYYPIVSQAVRVRSVRDAIRSFEANGHSSHSGLRMLLPYIIEHCERNKIDYTLNCKAGVGYFIRKGNHK